MTPRHPALALFACAAIAACAGGDVGTNATPNQLPATRPQKLTMPIAHVVIVIQENRSFDNLFATFPGADGTATGNAAAMPGPIASACAAEGQPVITQPTTVPLTKVSLTGAGFPKNFGADNDLYHTYSGYRLELDGGNMDGFDATKWGPDGEGPKAACTYPYQYVDPQDIAPYWDIAKEYVLADHTFQTQGSSSFTAHQDLIAGATAINSTESVIDNPDAFPWGCDSPPGTKTSLLTTSGEYLAGQGPFPCFSYATLRDRLDAKGVSWKYYSVAVHGSSAGIWNGFDAIDAVRHSKEWRHNVTTKPTVIFTDIADGHLPSVAWITPDASNSDHPAERNVDKQPVDTGPSWVASVVNAIGESTYWDSTAVIVLWDDWGGFYDHESPPLYDGQGGLGFRVPMLIVSPYVQAHVEHTHYEDGSILKFIEENWGLGSLGATDKRATSIGNAFDFDQSPRAFQVIPSKYDRSFFLHQKPSGQPPDTE